MSIYFCVWCIIILTYSNVIHGDEKHPETIDKLSTSIRTFGYHIYRTLFASGGNGLFSPISVHSVLALLYTGAKGKTKGNLKYLLSLPERDITDEYKKILEHIRNVFQDVSISNKIFVKSKLKLQHKFMSQLRNYNTEIENLLYRNKKRAINIINTWVKRKTQNLVSNLLVPDDIPADLYIVSGISLKSSWAMPFDKPVMKKFVNTLKETFLCEMMTVRNKFEIYSKAERKFEFIRLPYKNHKISLTIILPKPHIPVWEMANRLATGMSKFKFQGKLEDVLVTMPKFKVEGRVDFLDIFEKMQLYNIYHKIEVPKMINSTRPIRSGKLTNGLFLEVHENGSGIVPPHSVPVYEESGPPAYTFTVDRPFLYFLEASIEDERYVLLQGRYDGCDFVDTEE